MKKLNTRITATANLGNIDIGKEPTYGPSVCSVCGECTPLPGHHQCNPSYKQLEAQLATATKALSSMNERWCNRVERVTQLHIELATAKEENDKAVKWGIKLEGINETLEGKLRDENKRLRGIIETVSRIPPTHHGGAAGLVGANFIKKAEQALKE